MRIAYVTHYFPPAGFAASVNTYRIVKGLTERGHEMLVFCPTTYSEYTAGSSPQSESWASLFKVFRSLSTPLQLSTTIPHLFISLKALRRKYDLIITQFHLFHLASLAGFISKTLMGKPWVVKVHDMIPDSSLSGSFAQKIFSYSCYGAFLTYFGKRANKLMVLTSELQDLLLEKGYSADKTAIIPNGVDTKVFAPSKEKHDNNSKRTILYIGSILPEDGLEYLIRAFALIRKMNDLNLVVIGDGPKRSHMIELARNLGLDKRTTFYRYIPHEQIPKFVREAYITVGPLKFSPINNYTIPTKILEYFACGKPVVSSRVSKDILKDGSTGLVVKKIDSEEIAEKFSILLENEKLTAQMGNDARQLVVEKFDWENVITKIDKEIRNLDSHRFN